MRRRVLRAVKILGKCMRDLPSRRLRAYGAMTRTSFHDPLLYEDVICCKLFRLIFFPKRNRNPACFKDTQGGLYNFFFNSILFSLPHFNVDQCKIIKTIFRFIYINVIDNNICKYKKNRIYSVTIFFSNSDIFFKCNTILNIFK